MSISGAPQLAETIENINNKAVLPFPQGDMSISGGPQLAETTDNITIKLY